MEIRAWELPARDLQRIVNSGGRIERECGLGRRRTDLLVIWPHTGGTQRAVLELKVGSGTSETLLGEGLEQTAGYMDRSDEAEGHLVIFDRTARGTDLSAQVELFSPISLWPPRQPGRAALA